MKPIEEMLRLVSDEQAFEKIAPKDELSELIEKFKPAEEELGEDELEFIAAAGQGQIAPSFEDFLKRARKGK
ncbi:MAG: hypothetical protein J6P72_09655 [Firmicutes bacterium]|nr:hypothetical protein [Bacillota bacterium]